MLVAITQPRAAGRVLIYVVVLAMGLFGSGGCRSNDNEPGWAITGNEWPVMPRQELDHPAEDPTAVLFIVFVETPQDVVERMLKMARVTKDDVVCDLGCGDGRIVVTAAKEYGCRAIGYDLDPLRVEEARSNAERQGVADLVTIEQKDVLTVDLQGVSVVTLYMGSEINARLIPQLSGLPAGARIVSHDYGLADIPPDKTVTMTSSHSDRKHRIHLWRCPLPEATR